MKNQNRIAVGLLLLLGTISLADDAKPDPPKSLAAANAIEQCDKELAIAEKAYKQAQLAAQKKLVEKLKAPLIGATKSGDLEEANRISETIKAAQGQIAVLTEVADPFAGIMYMEWDIGIGSKSNKDWWMADGTAIDHLGERIGKWTRRGNIVSIKWPWGLWTVQVSADGKTATGRSDHGEQVFGTLMGTNLTGAEGPPK